MMVCHRKCQLVVNSFTEQRIFGNVLQKVIHPSHVPFVGKSQATIFRTGSYFRPCCRFFRDHHCSRLSALYNRIQVFQELYSFQIFISTILIWHPLTILFSIIQVKHRSYCICPKTIHMEFIQPEQRASDQEIHNFFFAVIKDVCSPVRVFS